MPFELRCPQCEKSLRAPDEMEGKQAVCPKCKTRFTATRSVVSSPAPSALDTTGSQEQWFVINSEKQRYGPVPYYQLAAWVKEGRIGGDFELQRDGDSSSQLASAVFPELAQTSAASNVPAPADEAYLEKIRARFKQEDFKLFENVTVDGSTLNLVATKPRFIGPQWTEEYFVFSSLNAPPIVELREFRSRAWAFALANGHPTSLMLEIVAAPLKLMSFPFAKLAGNPTPTTHQLFVTKSVYSIALTPKPTAETLTWHRGSDSTRVRRVGGQTVLEVSLVWDGGEMHYAEKPESLGKPVYLECKKVIQQRLIP